MPSRSISTQKNEMPRCPGVSGSVRAIRMPISANWPLEHHTFWPFTTNESPSGRAAVASDARSLPASGSLNSWHHNTSPLRVLGSQRRFWSSVPARRIASPASTMP